MRLVAYVTVYPYTVTNNSNTYDISEDPPFEIPPNAKVYEVPLTVPDVRPIIESRLEAREYLPEGG